MELQQVEKMIERAQSPFLINQVREIIQKAVIESEITFDEYTSLSQALMNREYGEPRARRSKKSPATAQKKEKILC